MPTFSRYGTMAACGPTTTGSLKCWTDASKARRQRARILEDFLQPECRVCYLKFAASELIFLMKTQRPIPSDGEHQVLQFRPRTSPHPQALHGTGTVQPLRAQPAPEPLDLSRYEQHRDEPDDFRHRMLANIAALAFTIALTAIGIWLAVSIADLRRTQDCVLMGRRDCVRIATPHI